MFVNSKSVIIILALLLLAGCSQQQPLTVQTVVPFTAVPPIVRPSATMTATHTATPMPTATLTPTPTPTYTPTPTAVPLTVIGDPRAAQLRDPTPQAGAPCGLVDTLDFPIDPPDAAAVSYGGGDFGVFRSRYDKYHAGEDWGGPTGRPNLGTPVYSIGHGLVTYAEPEGWNRDKGVVIVQHTFADGDFFYAFYGHLDPPSVVLAAGECVQRGQQIGDIGKPRTSPHLHFEIRTHMPYTPGPGYWPEDPTTAGWLPPSQTIWQTRLLAAPGGQWVRPPLSQGSHMLGLAGTATLVLLEDGQLEGLSVADGRVRWRYALAGGPTIAGGLVTPSAMYLADQFGRVLALPPPAEGDPTFTPLWELDLDVTGAPTLLPLPGGGVLLATRQQLTGISMAGTVLWQHELPARPFAWAAADELLALATADDEAGLWTVDQAGLTAWQTPGGRPVMVDGDVWVQAANGVYRLNWQTKAADWLLTLPGGFLRDGAMVALPDGGVLVAHRDLHDNHLIALNGDGTVTWDRSLRGIGVGEIALVAGDGRVYLVAQTTTNGANEVTLYAVDVDAAHLSRLFIGGSRTAFPTGTWAIPVGDLLLVNIGGGHLVALHPLTALAASQRAVAALIPGPLGQSSVPNARR